MVTKNPDPGSAVAKSKMFRFSPDLKRPILNCNPTSSDVILVSGLDRRAFRAHRLVLASASPVLKSLLRQDCQVCCHQPDQLVSILSFADIPAETLQQFLSLCYTGFSRPFKSVMDEAALLDFCQGLKLIGLTHLPAKSIASTDPSIYVDEDADSEVGYSECSKLLNMWCLEESRIDKMFAEVSVAEHIIRNPPQVGLETGFADSGDDNFMDESIPVTNENPLECPRCKKTFRSQQVCSKHTKHCNVITLKSQSAKSDEIFLSDNDAGSDGADSDDAPLKRNEPKFKCDECGNLFTRKHSLQVHQRKHSIKFEPVSCEECNITFKSEYNLNIHISLHHTDSDTVTCAKCKKSFARRQSLVRHICKMPDESIPKVNMLFRQDDDGKFHCLHDNCKEKPFPYQYKNGLSEHWLAKHATEEERIFDCPLCEKKFALNSLRNRHVKHNHKPQDSSKDNKDCSINTLSQPAKLYESLYSDNDGDGTVTFGEDSDEAMKPVQRKFKCDECGNLFTRKHSLLVHQRNHSIKFEPVSCRDCNLTFKSEHSLNIHISLHHIESENLKCAKCKKTFMRKSSLIRHICKIPDESIPKIKMLFVQDEDGKFQCLHEDCKEKPFPFQYKSGISDHWLDKHTTDEERIYGCSHCEKRFASIALKNRHVKGIHELQYECDQCKRKFKSNNALTTHIRTHTGEKPFVCHLCGADFRHRANWRQHVDQYHGDLKKHKCTECDKSFRLKLTLKEHMLKHQLAKQFNVDFKMNDEDENEDGKQAMYHVPKIDYPMKEEEGRFICTHPDCQEKTVSFQWKNGLREHYMERHASESEKHFPCKFCAKKFGSNALRNKHERIIHLLRFPCAHCDKKFGKKVSLIHHMRLHTGEKPFVCDTCGKGFSQKAYLKEHSDAHHPKDTTNVFPCGICGKKFNTKKMLSRHDKGHLSRHSCPECDKKFGFLNSLKLHMRCHTGERPFVCEICGASFTQKVYLLQHTDYQHPKGEVKKEHKCETCGKLFRLKGQMKNHIKMTHVEGRPFVCDECGKDYKDVGALRKHKETHSGVQLPCELCNDTFNSRANLNRHYKRKHKTRRSLIKKEKPISHVPKDPTTKPK